MGQLFHRSFNTLAKFSILGGVVLFAATVWVLYLLNRSPYRTGVGHAPDQPVPFSHDHHARGLGIDCRYCHTTAETGPVAGIPPTKTCMNCHSQIWADSPMLEPVRRSFRENKPLEWTRVHDLPDFAYFDHSIHVQKGIGCTTCHGDVGKMPLMRKDKTLQMRWCLECHREPEKFVRPKEEVFSLDWHPPVDQTARGRELAKKYGLRKMTDCSACHR